MSTIDNIGKVVNAGGTEPVVGTFILGLGILCIVRAFMGKRPMFMDRDADSFILKKILGRHFNFVMSLFFGACLMLGGYVLIFGLTNNTPSA